ncbi:hypothetical protein [Anaeropeptidivorans aminofermentans]|uniref:hypothetical protein n=1 Tax=Anaeropeptidivorans aminofermentans TaxID=2934315 RepID=UPI00202506F5|nr:hypothetical protein [Anaeropeptidivorans aminofermentans]MBE6012056.1 hypothetical protein [Lachnospiraceae bacterium]
MDKLPPIEKIYEAYSAIADGRIAIFENQGEVLSSSRSKTYIVTWNENTYTSSDNGTYWQGYAGYPIIAVLMLQGKIPYNTETIGYFREVNWTEINARHKADYRKAADEVLSERIPSHKLSGVLDEVHNAYEVLQELEINIKRGKNRPPSAKKK